MPTLEDISVLKEEVRLIAETIATEEKKSIYFQRLLFFSHHKHKIFKEHEPGSYLAFFYSAYPLRSPIPKRNALGVPTATTPLTPSPAGFPERSMIN